MSLGIKGSQTGYDVKGAADYHLTFTSAAPLLKIESQGTFSLADGSLDQDIVDHDLGYYPLVWVFITGTRYGAHSSGQSRMLGTSVIAVSTSKLRWLGNWAGEASDAVTGYYYIFRHNLLTTYEATPDVTSATSQDTSDSFGIRVTGPDKDVSSTDYRDFVVHTDTRSPQVHMAGAVSDTPPITVTHDLGYIPLYFPFFKQTVSTVDYYSPFATGGDSGTDATTTNVTFGVAGATDFAYVILRDPFEID